MYNYLYVIFHPRRYLLVCLANKESVLALRRRIIGYAPSGPTNTRNLLLTTRPVAFLCAIALAWHFCTHYN